MSEPNCILAMSKENWSLTDMVSNVPPGAKYLGNMLSVMSIKYQCYTNHSARFTRLQALEDFNIDGHHVI